MGSGGHPTFQLVPSEYTGTATPPLPTTVDPKEDPAESDTKDRAPAPEVEALGSVATVNTVVGGITEADVLNWLRLLSI
jgi:hypothetical protein